MGALKPTDRTGVGALEHDLARAIRDTDELERGGQASAVPEIGVETLAEIPFLASTLA